MLTLKHACTLLSGAAHAVHDRLALPLCSGGACVCVIIVVKTLRELQRQMRLGHTCIDSPGFGAGGPHAVLQDDFGPGLFYYAQSPVRSLS